MDKITYIGMLFPRNGYSLSVKKCAKDKNSERYVFNDMEDMFEFIRELKEGDWDAAQLDNY